MKMYEIIELTNLYSSISNVKLPLKTTYKFARLMKRADEELAFYQEKFREILDEYGQKDENGNFITSENGESVNIISGKEAECNTKLFELRNLEVDIDNISFTIEELENLNISISELGCMLSLIKD